MEPTRLQKRITEVEQELELLKDTQRTIDKENVKRDAEDKERVSTEAVVQGLIDRLNGPVLK